MMYEHIVDRMKEVYEGKDASELGRHTAMQFNIWGEGHGALYLEIRDGKVHVEPYEYFDRDALISTDAQTLLGIADGRIDPTSYADLYVEGDPSVLEVLRWLSYTEPEEDPEDGDEDPESGQPSDEDEKGNPKARSVKDKAGAAVETVKKKAGGAAETVKKKAGGAAETVKKKAGMAAETVKKKAGSAADSVRERIDDVIHKEERMK